MQSYVRGLIGLGIAAALAAVGAAGRAEAGVLLVKGRSVRENTLPPLVPLPDGTVVSASDIVLRSWRVDLGDDDVLVYNVADGSVSRYGDANTLSLATFGMAFGASVMIADPRTLTFSTIASQEMTLGAILDQPGFMVMVDVGPATVPASVLSLGADDLHTPTPPGPPTPTRTATPTGLPTNTVAPTVTTTALAQPSPTPTNPGGATPTPPAAVSTATPTATVESTQPCRGDCDDDNVVTVDELVRAVNIALGTLPTDQCEAVDADASGTVTVDELVAAVGKALSGCV